MKTGNFARNSIAAAPMIRLDIQAAPKGQLRVMGDAIMTRGLALGIVIGFIAGFATCLTWVQVTRHTELAEVFERGREARDAEAYRNLHPLVDVRVLRKYSNFLYDLEPVEGGASFPVRWCDAYELEVDWIIRGAVTELRDHCLSLHMDKAQIKVVTTLTKEIRNGN